LISRSTGCFDALTNEVVDSVAHHGGGLGRAVEPDVLGHRLLLLGGVADLLQDQTGKQMKIHAPNYSQSTARDKEVEM